MLAYEKALSSNGCSYLLEIRYGFNKSMKYLPSKIEAKGNRWWGIYQFHEFHVTFLFGIKDL